MQVFWCWRRVSRVRGPPWPPLPSRASPFRQVTATSQRLHCWSVAALTYTYWRRENYIELYRNVRKVVFFYSDALRVKCPAARGIHQTGSQVWKSWSGTFSRQGEGGAVWIAFIFFIFLIFSERCASGGRGVGEAHLVESWRSLRDLDFFFFYCLCLYIFIHISIASCWELMALGQWFSTFFLWAILFETFHLFATHSKAKRKGMYTDIHT